MNQPSRVRRSMLIMPVNNDRFVERSWTRGADVINLDLEDSVPPTGKASARDRIAWAVATAGRGGSAVEIRINSDDPDPDVRAAVLPGVAQINHPKTESAAQIRHLDEIISRLEIERGIPPGSVAIGADIETALGVSNAYEIATASRRLHSFGSGVGGYDMSLDLDVAMFVDFDQFAYIRGETELAARAVDLEPIGSVFLPASADVGDGDVAGSLARANRRAGFHGLGIALHPSAVPPLTRGYTPTQEELGAAHRVMEAFAALDARGEAHGVVAGVQVDRYAAQAAQRTIDWAQACRAADERLAGGGAPSPAATASTGPQAPPLPGPTRPRRVDRDVPAAAPVRRSYLRASAATLLDSEDIWRSFADVVVIDPLVRDDRTRPFVQLIEHAGRGGAEVFARIELTRIESDLERVVHLGLVGVAVQVHGGDEVAQVDAALTALEPTRGIRAGATRIMATVGSARGVWSVRDIVASARVCTVHFDADGLRADLGLDRESDLDPFVVARGRVVVEARAAGVQPIGSADPLGWPEPLDVTGLAATLRLSRNLGLAGAICPKATWVDACHRAFSTPAEELERHRETRRLFADGVRRGTASVPRPGTTEMIDIPVDEQARRALQWHERCAARDAAKRAAIAQAERGR